MANKILITIKGAEINPRKAKPPKTFLWGEQIASASVYDEQGREVEKRQVKIPVELKDGEYIVWPDGVYAAPAGSYIGPYGTLEFRMFPVLTPVKKAA